MGHSTLHTHVTIEIFIICMCVHMFIVMIVHVGWSPRANLTKVLLSFSERDTPSSPSNGKDL